MAEQNENQPHTIGSSLPVQRSSQSLTNPAADAEKSKTLTMLLSRLAIHYYRPDFTEGQARLLIQDYVRDLADFDVVDVDTAIREYRQQPTKGRGKFFPDSAQLRELAAAAARHRAAMAKPVRQPLHRDSRPVGWYLRPRKAWAPHWRESEVPEQYRALIERAEREPAPVRHVEQFS